MISVQASTTTAGLGQTSEHRDEAALIRGGVPLDRDTLFKLNRALEEEIAQLQVAVVALLNANSSTQTTAIQTIVNGILDAYNQRITNLEQVIAAAGLSTNSSTLVSGTYTAIVATLQNLAFSATATGTNNSTLGTKTFTVNSADRVKFFAADYLSAVCIDDPTIAMTGQLQTYNPNNGQLTISVLTAESVGETGSNWRINVTPPPILAEGIDGGSYDSSATGTQAQVDFISAANDPTQTNLSTQNGVDGGNY